MLLMLFPLTFTLHCSNYILSINWCLLLVYVADKSVEVLTLQDSLEKVTAHILHFNNIYDRSVCMYVCIQMHTVTLSLTSTREQKAAAAFHPKKQSHFSAAEILGID